MTECQILVPAAIMCHYPIRNEVLQHPEADERNTCDVLSFVTQLGLCEKIFNPCSDACKLIKCVSVTRDVWRYLDIGGCN